MAAVAVAVRNQRKKRAPSATTNSSSQPGPPPGSGLYTYNGRIHPAPPPAHPNPNPDSIEVASTYEDHFHARKLYDQGPQGVSIAQAVEILQRRQDGGQGQAARQAVGRLRGQVLLSGRRHIS